MKSKTPLIFSLIVATLIWLANATANAQFYVANLDGPSENPANASPGTGFAQVTLDLVLHTLQIDVTFSGLTGTTTAAHIHAPTLSPFSGNAGVATQTPFFTGFPIGVTSGSYSHSFDTSVAATYNPAYVTANTDAAGAEAALALALADGKAYFNIHSMTFPGGEIRGFLVPVPEPTTIGLIVIGGIGLLFATRKAQRG